MAGKSKLYKVYLDRQNNAYENDYFFESSWYSYAILEDRLVSLLRQTGGTTDANGNPLRMLGNKLEELKWRRNTDADLKAVFPDHKNAAGTPNHGRLNDLYVWKENRNRLIHGMADGTISLTDIDKMVYDLATDGLPLVRDFCSAAMRLKKRLRKNP